ncbi:ABC-three component system protein [Sphingobacterium multivorum]
MTQLINPNDIHSAADTWNGFIYQGKVALYHVLKLINEKADVIGLHLQLDSLEDFAIVRYEDGEPKPVSLHQVKAVNSHYYSKYKTAFEKLERRKDDFPCDDDAFFHLAVQNEKTNQEIEGIHKKLKIYDYNGNHYCRIEELNDLIKVQAGMCLDKFNLTHLSNNNYIETLCNELESLISNTIVDVHSQNHSPNGDSINKLAYYNTISLIRFVQIIQSDIAGIIQDKNYFTKKLKTDLNRYYQEFCFEREDEILESQQLKLHKYLIYLNGLNNLEFERFLQKIMPHRYVKFSNIQEYKDNSLLINEVKGAFLSILNEIKESDDLNKIGWIDDAHKKYYPSTIVISNTATSKLNISIDILKTVLETLVDVPFNADFIITEGCNVPSIAEEANKSTRINQLDLEALNGSSSHEYDKITSWKNMSLIDLEQAKQKLNENIN